MPRKTTTPPSRESRFADDLWPHLLLYLPVLSIWLAYEIWRYLSP